MRSLRTLVSLSACCVVIFITSGGCFAQPVMIAHYINMGQADATLLEFPCGAILIDAGAQDDAHVDTLLNYLEAFFTTRPDLNNTLNSIIITHNHIDHTRALREVVEKFTVERYIDNGQLGGPGTGDPAWVRNNFNTAGRNITLREIDDDDITALSHKNGLTDADIDPLVCTNCDPQIRILSGRLDTNPGWSHRDFDNKNNHSIVVRVDFGGSSFLFTGDLEEDAIETMVLYYENETTLDVDVYQVGHHGSHNRTNENLLDAMTPEIAVISMGDWEFGRGSRSRFTTFAYGHPRRVVLDMLTISVGKKRSQPIDVWVGEGARDFRPYRVSKKIYGTGWDGTVKVRAKLDGTFRVTLSN